MWRSYLGILFIYHSQSKMQKITVNVAKAVFIDKNILYSLANRIESTSSLVTKL